VNQERRSPPGPRRDTALENPQTRRWSRIVLVTVLVVAALVLEPWMRKWFLRPWLSLPWAAALTTTLFVLFVLIPLSIVVTLLVRDGVELVNELRQGALSADSLGRYLDAIVQALPFNVPREEILKKGSALIEQIAGHAINLATLFAASIPVFLFEMAIVLVTLYYGLVDGRHLFRKIRNHLPFSPETNERVLETADGTVRGGFLGAVLSAVAQALVLWIAYLALGIPNSTIAGMTTFFTSFVPVLGSIPAGVVGLLVLAIEGAWFKMGILVALLVFAGTVDNLIKPIVLKGSVDLHPLLGLLSALGGMALMGFIGIFIGPMLTALALELFHILEEERRVARN